MIVETKQEHTPC